MKHVEVTFTVTATDTQFPIDMLRYDGCIPATEKDSDIIVDTFSETAEYGTKYTVTLVKQNAYKHWTPNTPRWYSFGWELVK